MKRLTVWRSVGTPSPVVWGLLTNPDRWPEWGPTVRSAELDGRRLQEGARGTVTTAGGVKLPFEVTEYSEGAFWAWNVAGLPATDHRVQEDGADRCRVGFGVPWPAAAYLTVCQVALRRLEAMALDERANT